MSDAAAAPVFKEARHRGLITISVMAAMIMQVLDTTIANVALPHMQASLGAAQDTITWVESQDTVQRNTPRFCLEKENRLLKGLHAPPCT